MNQPESGTTADSRAEARARRALVRGLAALYRAAVLDVLMNRYRWSAETATRAADDVEAAVRARVKAREGDGGA